MQNVLYPNWFSWSAVITQMIPYEVQFPTRSLIFSHDENVEKCEKYSSGCCKINDWILGEPDVNVG